MGPPAADPDPIIYWNAELKFAGAALDTGLDWTDVHGSVASVGLYDRTRLGAVLGNAWFDRATIAKQPVTSAKMTFRVRPQEPDPIRPGHYAAPVVEFPDLTGTLYGGTVGGEARVVLDDTTRYRVCGSYIQSAAGKSRLTVSESPAGNVVSYTINAAQVGNASGFE